MKDFTVQEFEEMQEAMTRLDDENIHILSVDRTVQLY